jgi:hypothetical protein
VVQRWQKLGLVFRPDPALPWQRSHAQMPTPLPLGGPRYRIYFAARDDRSRSHVGWFELDLDGPRVVDRGEAPLLEPGGVGRHDGDGVIPASVVEDGDRLLLYTVGWNVGTPPPLFYASTGLAISEDGGRSFTRTGPGPLLDRSDHDPCLACTPHVLREGDRWRMWYVSGLAWDEIDGALKSLYHVKYAESGDGLAWRRDGVVALDNRLPQERNVTRAFVVRDGDRYRVWYSSDRGAGYRIGYAESGDGIAWERRDEDLAGLEPTPGDWDSDALAYPAVLRHDGRWFLLYNGNGFGRDGIGLATWEP